MATTLDPTPLRAKGVSEGCIHLLCLMLQTDPSRRPTDRDCLAHPWLQDGTLVPEAPSLHSIKEEDESEFAGERLSQLSLFEEDLSTSDEAETDEVSEVLDDEEFELLIDGRAPKKVRTDPQAPGNQNEHSDDETSSDSELYPEDVSVPESYTAGPQNADRKSVV